MSSILKTRLTLSWRRSLSYRNQSIDLLRKSMDWFLYDNGLRHEMVKRKSCLHAETTQLICLANPFPSFYMIVRLILTQFSPMHPFFTPWKHQKTLQFSNVFTGERKGALGTNGLNGLIHFSPVLYFIQKSVIRFAEQNKWLVSM